MTKVKIAMKMSRNAEGDTKHCASVPKESFLLKMLTLLLLLTPIYLHIINSYYLYIIGTKKELCDNFTQLSLEGMNLYPLEIETYYRTHIYEYISL